MSSQLNDQGFCSVTERDQEQETVLETSGDHWKRWGERSGWRNEGEEEGGQDWELKEARQVGGSKQELGLETNVTTTDFIKHYIF